CLAKHRQRANRGRTERPPATPGAEEGAKPRLRTSERAVARRRLVDLARSARGDDLDGDRLRADGALVPQDMDVAAARVDEALTGRVHGGRARRVIALVLGDRAGLDSDQAGPGMRVPAGAAAGGDDVRHDVEVGRALGVDVDLVAVDVGPD